jgi:hypothetical protein
MYIVIEAQLDISGYATGTETELPQDLMAWLHEDRSLPGASVFQVDSHAPEIVSLAVRPPADSDFLELANAMFAWLHARHLTSHTITIRFTNGRTTTVLQSIASDAELERVLTTLATRDAAERIGKNVTTGQFVTVSGVFATESRGRSKTTIWSGDGAADSNSQSPGFDRLTEDASALVMPVTIYLSNERIHGQVETAIEELLATAGLQIESRDDPIMGSWFRPMLATIKKAVRSPAAREATLVAAHVADTRLVLAQDAAVTATFLQNLGPVLAALQPTKDAVIRAGALLIVKVDWTLHVFQLTAAQQAKLDHQPQLARSPHEIIAALNLTPDDHKGADYPELT